MDDYGVSVVIPTLNRADLLERLLASLYEDRKSFRYGSTEVIVVDSSVDQQKQLIMEACKKHDVRYLEGPDSVRKKRNMGIRAAKNPFIVFEDSDVVVEKGLLNHHVETFLRGKDDPTLGGSFGLTTFVGKDNFVWNVIQYTTLTESFSFAEKWPYQDWTIGNNVSFKKTVLEDVNLFEENFPFRLGADDLDLTYRITKKGYRIKSQPEAITYHAKDTWQRWPLVRERAVRWGRMEHYISLRHPEIFVNAVPKNCFLVLPVAVVFGLLSLLTTSLIPMKGFSLWLLLMLLGSFIMDGKKTGKWNPIFYFPARYLHVRYDWGHILEGLKNKSLAGIYKRMSFSCGQTKIHLKEDSQRLCLVFVNLMIAAVFILALM